MKFIALIQKQPAVYSFEGAVKFKFRLALEDNRKRLEFVENLLREVVGG